MATGLGYQVKGLDRLYRALDAYEKGESQASSFASYSAAQVYAGAAEASLARAIGADRQLSSINKKARNPATLKVITIRQRVGRGTGAGWVARAVPQGQWAIVEKGTRPHLIGVPGVRRRATRRQQGKATIGALAGFFGASTSAWWGKTGRPILKLPRDYATGPVYHPGTRGKHPFDIGTLAAESKAKKVWETTYLTRSARLLVAGG